MPKFCEHYMKTLIKRIVIHLYCHGRLSAAATARLFSRLNLRGA